MRRRLAGRSGGDDEGNWRAEFPSTRTARHLHLSALTRGSSFTAHVSVRARAGSTALAQQQEEQRENSAQRRLPHVSPPTELFYFSQ